MNGSKENEVTQPTSNYGTCGTCKHMIRWNKASKIWKHFGPGAEARADHKASAA